MAIVPTVHSVIEITSLTGDVPHWWVYGPGMACRVEWGENVRKLPWRL